MNKYHCWFVLGCLFLVYMASNGMVLNTFTQYTPELMKHWSLDFKGASSFQSTIYLVLALPLPFVGLLLQRSSPKRMMIGGSVGIALSLLIFANAGSIGMMRLFTIIFPLFLSVVGLLTCMYLINNWFSKYRGIATGILLMASSVGPAIFAPVLGKWIATIGWQKAATYEAIICSLLIFIPALFVKNHPKDVNGQIGGLFFLCSLFGKLIFGFISDKFDVKKIMLISVFNMLIGCVFLWMSVKNPAFMIPYAVVLSIGYSGTFTMIQLYVMKLYGGPGYGSILGMLSFVDTLCLAMGGMLFGIIRKAGVDYSNPFLLMIVLTLVSLLATFIINRRTDK